MNRRRRLALLHLATLLIIVTLLGTGQEVEANPNPGDLILTDLSIRAELGIDCQTNLELSANVTNVGVSDSTVFEIRLDVRGLIVLNSTVDSLNATTTVVPEENYVVLSVFPTNPVTPLESVPLDLSMTTLCLQERIGLDTIDNTYSMQLIYYFRPVSEVRGFSFTALLPQHAILEADSTSALFPRPTSNHTDGASMAFVWYIDSLLPGQESAFIVKYEIPALLVDSATQAGMSTGLLIALAALVGAAVVLSVERIPGIVKQMRMTTIIDDASLSEHEEEILSVITRKGGSCPQREIYEGLDMSQSMVSMVLSSLEQRGIIKRLKSGRENIVHMMEA